MKKKILSVYLAICGGIAFPAIADISGSCWPTETPAGSAHPFTISKTLTASDIPGVAEQTWSNSGNFEGTCFCGDPYKDESVFFRFTSTILNSGSGKRQAGYTYYPLDKHPGIGIGFKVKIGGNAGESGLIPVDLQNTTGVDNEYPNKRDCDENQPSHPFATGSEGIVSLEFTQPLSGSVNIVEPELLTIYARKKNGNFDFSRPFVKLSFNLTVNIPPQCFINGGQKITVPFGNIVVNEFTPEATSKQKSIPLSITCKNPEDISKVSVKFRTSDFNDSGYIRTHDKTGERGDLGIKLEHNAKKIDGNSAAILPQEGNITITATPVRQGERPPTPGEFEATSTLDFEFK
ncbi:fimbrial protein [Cedecea sp.]|jgi:type 1 fimbria pilin|uniref:fimbrial protein n=1 Tax=Cedecea sp. TaxID=1970739 RepID=UPI002F3E3F6E